MKKHKSYLIWALIFILIPITLLTTANELMLGRSGEYLSGKEISLRQADKKSFNIYGSAVSDKALELKLESYQRIQPDIVSIGSSRTLQFRQKFFKKPFYNMGLTAGSVGELRDITNTIVKLHKPQIMIIGADFWWFHPEKENLSTSKKEERFTAPYKDLAARIENLTLPFQWIQEGSINLVDYTDLLFSTPEENIGVRGKLRSAGIAPDGSYYYTDRVIGEHSNKNEQFHETKERIEQGKDQFIYGSKASTLLIDDFNRITKSLQDQGIEVFVFFPPVAPKILSELHQRNYQYIKEIEDIFRERNIAHFNFLDPAQIGPASDCEFIDGFHGGDVLYGRIILKMAHSSPVLSKITDKGYLQEVDGKYKGYAMIPEPRVTSRAEVDFLKLGCRK
ncbi:MAG: hypothetical protein DI586_10090 [Micavibrio aeruginosavorus]|uniref:Uncharacterized protein n=1 Tax=Micavibrio aeruginosavorus TaxID=349221 RepID=A0A2W5FKH1_9BACT|nr:MAG: hypothetical protein DI586_10090 [Micavibrio aeruginosavorus]